MKTIKVTITLEVNTANTNESIELALKKGIYRGLDSYPYYIAQPRDVNIIDIKQEEKKLI